MIITNKTSQCEERNILPQILALNSGGEPVQWLSFEDVCYLTAKQKVLWSLGTYEVKLFGGTNAKTGLQSTMAIDTIIAVANDKSPSKYRRSKSPTLTNKTLFERDRNTCAYCGGVFNKTKLTREHIVPISKAGNDTWENCVTCCVACNQWKGDKTLEEADLQLRFLPYVPSYHEALILQNRNILPDQKDYLMKGVSKFSRVHNDLQH